ncbi:MAG: hypothetical protein KI791_16705 [Cyclobacteriaceae bacterium]|nr:hypothetical protein [Cyclobacteriaceae bacterium SS2]
MNIDFKRISILSLLLAGLVLFNACNEDGEMDGGDPPAMPPASSMSPDFNYFDEGGDESGRVDVVNSWVYAATNVTVYSAILGSTLIVPVTAYKVALTQDVTFDADLGLWIWAYDVNVGAHGEFAVKLTAEIQGPDVIWTGSISKAGVFEDFVWFEGTSAINGESGSWTLYESFANPTPWLSAEWEKSDVDGKANVTFTVEKEGNSLNSSISYTASATGDFNRSVVIVDTHADNTITVDWHSVEKNGRVKSAAHFQDDAFHCWDSQLHDVDC